MAWRHVLLCVFSLGSEDNTGDGEDADAEAAAKEDSTPKEREVC